MKRPSLLRFVPMGRFEVVVPIPAPIVRERLKSCATSSLGPNHDSPALSGTVDGDAFELRLRDLTANSGRAFLVGEIEGRGTSTVAIGRVCMSSAPAVLFAAIVGLGIAIRSGVAVVVAAWALAILAFGHAKTRGRTLNAFRKLLSEGH